MGTFDIYKPGQGKYTRTITFISGAVLAVIGAHWLSRKFETLNFAGAIYVRFGVPVVVLAALAAVLFWVVNRPRTADFMIATEGEMKKVSWSNRREIVGSTKVVIFATFAMALVLFLVDYLFSQFFALIKVLEL